MMTPMWIALFKVLVLIFALFTTYEAKDFDGVINEIFTITNDTGVVLFNNTTTADSAPFMPIPTKRADPPQKQSPIPEPNRHYHQYHSLNQPDQYFKVQRSPDGKLNLVFNDTFVSLQETSTEVLSDQPPSPRHPSDFKTRPPTTRPLKNVTKSLRPCGNAVSQDSKTFCSEVDYYPDLSGLKQKLENNFSKFFFNDLQPTEVSSRSDVAEERFFCKSTRRLMYPKKGMKTDNTWQLIVNNDDYKQAIQIEECEEEGQPCDYATNFPNTYKPFCKQLYMQQSLASIKNEGELDVVQENFLIPSCCKCALKT
ncbi:protein spaetzle isoform X11 [Drosophila eugracilis]|uniref:protein spaetzle isoform X11 n=1 Tax=Drosophila eugracilis TaxID=29029 RepID=UPI001BD9442D|nr:protein spaetzle isoform X11 [Drosophila eugracilis]